VDIPASSLSRFERGEHPLSSEQLARLEGTLARLSRAIEQKSGLPNETDLTGTTTA